MHNPCIRTHTRVSGHFCPLLLIKSEGVFESASTLNPPGIDFPRAFTLAARRPRSRQTSRKQIFTRGQRSHVCGLYFPATRARAKIDSFSNCECIFDLPRFTRKIIPLPVRIERKREYSRVPFVLTRGALIGMRRHAFRWATNERISARRLESDVYLLACWLVGGMDLFGCWMSMYQITRYFPTHW